MMEQNACKRRIAEPVQGLCHSGQKRALLYAMTAFLASNTLQTAISCELHLYPTMQQWKDSKFSSWLMLFSSARLAYQAFAVFIPLLTEFQKSKLLRMMSFYARQDLDCRSLATLPARTLSPGVYSKDIFDRTCVICRILRIYESI